MREHYEQSQLSKRVLDNIRYLAALNNMTQADLAKRMRISPSYISEIFGAKKSAFYPTIIERAAETFGITPGMRLEELHSLHKPLLRPENIPCLHKLPKRFLKLVFR